MKYAILILFLCGLAQADEDCITRDFDRKLAITGEVSDSEYATIVAWCDYLDATEDKDESVGE